ncbi:MAG: hypothetical protein K2X93_24980 [Candidatus Obscuribacterales bacterium]|nr:hypothetical protein [Candidatus Obscuribacterales bacterium]
MTVTAEKKKVIREHGLPCQPGTLSLELTGEWQVLRVEGRYAAPNLYIMEDDSGPKMTTHFQVVPTASPVDTAKVTNGNVYLGSYSVPGNMLHVFGPNSALNN